MRRRLIAFAATVVVLAACSGDVRLPAAVEAPPTTTAEEPSTTALPPDTSGCSDTAPASSAKSATASYPALESMPTPGNMPAGTPMADILAKGKLTVGVSGDTLLFGFRDPLSGEIQGFDIDMLTYVAQAIFGGSFEEARSKLEFKVIPYSQRLPSLQDGSVDLVAHTMTINCRRWQQIAFSSEYFAAGQRVLVKKGSGFESVEDLVKAGATVCAPESSTNYDELIKPEYDGLKVETRLDVTDCLVAMQQGEVDAASGDDTVLAGLQAQDPTTAVVGTTFTSEPYGIGANAANTKLVEFVNGVLDQIRSNGEWTNTYKRWLVGPLGDDVPAPPPANESRPVPKP